MSDAVILTPQEMTDIVMVSPKRITRPLRKKATRKYPIPKSKHGLLPQQLRREFNPENEVRRSLIQGARELKLIGWESDMEQFYTLYHRFLYLQKSPLEAMMLQGMN